MLCLLLLVLSCCALTALGQLSSPSMFLSAKELLLVQHAGKSKNLECSYYVYSAKANRALHRELYPMKEMLAKIYTCQNSEV